MFTRSCQLNPIHIVILYSLKQHFNIILGPASDLFISGFQTRILFVFSPSLCVLHAPPMTYFITLKMLGREWKLWSFWSRNCLHSSVPLILQRHNVM